MAGITYNAFDIQVTDFPICGSVTIEDLSTWPTQPLFGIPATVAFDRADVKLVVFWRDDAGIMHWDTTDPNPGTWTVAGYTHNGLRNIEVFAVPVAFTVPPGRHGDNNENLFQGMVVFDPSDSNYYITIPPFVDLGVNFPSGIPGSFTKIDDTVMTIDQIRNYFFNCWLTASTGSALWSRYQHLFAYQLVSFYIYCSTETLDLDFSVTNSCTQITLENQTSTPPWIKDIWNFQWQNTAMAIFVVDGIGVLVGGGYFPNLSNIPDGYSITVPGNGIYTVYAFLNEKHFAYLEPYVLNDIVYINNDFAISDGAGNFNNIPFTLSGLQTFIDYNGTGAGWIGSFVQNVNINCQDESLTFTTETSPACDFISLRDETLWPVKGGIWNRSQSAIAVWCNYNGSWFYDVNNFGTDLVQGEWLLPITGNGIYSIYAFCVPVWDVAMTHQQNSIIFYAGMFYLATAPHVAGEATPNLAAGWQLLTAADFLIFSTYWFGDPDFYYGMYQTQVSINCVSSECPECPPASGLQSPIINSGCHLYTLLNPLFDTTQNVVVKLYPIDMSELISCQIIDVINGQGSIDITTPEDNVYVLQVGYQVSDGVTCEIDYEQQYMEYPIYDFCSALTCFMSMNKTILCNELDPCCRNCDPEYLAQRQIFREELNKMIALFMLLYGYLNVDNAEYLQLNLMFQFDINSGVYNPIVPDRNIVIGNIQDIINKLKDITGRCGDCNGTRTDTTTTPCTNCGGN
jgi:hypothetical protein